MVTRGPFQPQPFRDSVIWAGTCCQAAALSCSTASLTELLCPASPQHSLGCPSLSREETNSIQ